VRRRRPFPYGPNYDRYGYSRPRYPRDYYYGPQPGYGYRYRQPGSGCLRDACLLETGCCVAEGLDGNCLLLLAPAAPALLTALVGAGRGRRAGGVIAPRLVAAIRIYQREVSAHRPAVCRFTPSCSAYAAEALTEHGTVRGTTLAVRRLLRCRPGGRRGADPVPPASAWRPRG
jgi:putative membrane protein insertion efficiency factor